LGTYVGEMQKVHGKRRRMAEGSRVDIREGQRGR